MNRITISAITALFALTLAGCASGNNASSETAPNETPEVQETESAQPTTERPTDRERNIEETTDFEYEILDKGAVITRYTGNETEVVIPSSIENAPVVEIGFYAFEAKYDLRAVTLPDTLTLIGEGAFMDCTSLESINIPETVTGIDRGAFVDCVSLTEITVPAACGYIREEAFTACEGLRDLTIMNPDIIYENWGLEWLPDVAIHAPEGSAAQKWAESLPRYTEDETEVMY
jgi:hypothetical protein